MQRDYVYSAATHASDLLLAEDVGFLAAKRAASRLNSKKIKSCTLDVIFEPRVAKSILSSFCSCASGTSIARGTSFLNNQLSWTNEKGKHSPWFKLFLNARNFYS